VVGPKFTLPERREIKKIAKSKPAEHDLPFSTWSLSKLAEFLVAEGVVDDISHEGLRVLLREEGVSFQRVKTWKTSRDPDYQVKKARIEHLYAVADGEVIAEAGEPTVIFCLDEFGPLNLLPRPGRQWAAISGKGREPGRDPRPRMRATYTRTQGVRHLFAAYDLSRDKLYGHVKDRKTRRDFLELWPLHPFPVPALRAHRDHRGQLLPAPDHPRRRPSRGMGVGQQRRDRLYPDQLLLAQPDRSPVHRPALLRPGRHRPRHAQRAGQHDPPVHHLAQ
jgi:hypothetical protein